MWWKIVFFLTCAFTWASGRLCSDRTRCFSDRYNNETRSLTVTCHCDVNTDGKCTVPEGFWSNWSPEVRNLDVNQCKIQNISHLADRFPHLESLKLSACGLRMLNNNSFSGLSNLQLLNLSQNLLKALESNTFEGLRTLKVLDLSHNNLNYLRGTVFAAIRNVSELYLNDNRLERIEGNLPTLTKLEKLNLARNQLTAPIFVKDNIRLKWIDLSDNFIDDSFIVYDWHNTPTLSWVNLSANHIDRLDAQFLVNWKPYDELVLDLRHNNIATLDKFSRYDVINDIHKGRNVKRTLYLQDNPITCDCEVFHFIHYANQVSHKWTVDVSSLKCYQPEFWRNVSLISAPLCPCANRLQQRNLSRTLNQCHLRTWNDPLVDLTRWSISVNRQVVDLSHHQLNSINQFNWSALLTENLPNVKHLDLSYNNISNINRSVVDSWSQYPSLNISLGHNPWLCDCQLIHLYNFLRNSPERVQDIDQVTCAGNVTLIDLWHTTLCPLDVTPVAVSIFVLVMVLICIIMIRHWWPLWSFRLRFTLSKRDPEDEDRPYDAFISHSHQDESFVMEQLRPNLEPKYRLLLHQRDWLCGQWIPDQIQNSVASSKRTIIILTEHFLQSQWAQLEFRTAYDQDLQEKRNRLIFIVVGQLPDQKQMSSDMRRFVSLCTYLKWGDPWFWNRLKYALPKKNLKQSDLNDPSALQGHLPPLPLRPLNPVKDV